MEKKGYFLSSDEFTILDRHKKLLEKRLNIELLLPSSKSSCEDIIFATIIGDERKRKIVEKFLQRKLKIMQTKQKGTVVDGTTVITLDSDSSEEDISENSICDVTLSSSADEKNKISMPDNMPTQLISVNKEADNSTIEVNDSQMSYSQAVSNQLPEFIPLPLSQKKRRRRYKTQQSAKRMRMENTTSSVQSVNLDESIIIIEQNPSLCCNTVPDVIELDDEMDKTVLGVDESIICLSEDNSAVPVPRLIVPMKLRPVAIDGSNVARQHRQNDTFSSKGIEIAINYFVNKGHTQVVAFIPLFRRHRVHGKCPTTDPEILEKLASSEHLIFTPSRKVNGRLIQCYDDRFVVQYASTNGGVILSNDNFRDLIDESESFKETIQKRLLMFCFVGDQIMIPDDPLGRHGPKLSEFLSFPPELDC